MTALKFGWTGMRQLLDRLTRIEKEFNSPGALKRTLGRTLVAQTKMRIEHEKAAPDGTRWKPWAPSYAATRGPQHSLLMDSRAMLQSIRASVTKDGVSVTSDRVYSGVQNEVRPFLGISDKNEEEILQFVNDWMAKL